MQTVSSDYVEIISGEHRKEVKLSVNGVEYGMDRLAEMKTSRYPFGQNTPEIGLAVAGTLEVGMYAPASDIPRMAELRPYVRVVNDTKQSEWIPKGVYYIDTRRKNSGDYLEIEAYDSMLRAEQYLTLVDADWPMTDINAVGICAAAMNVLVDARTVQTINQGFSIPLPAQYTVREILANIAALYGGSFIMNDFNMLQLVCMWDKPPESYYLVDPEGNYVLFGGNRIILR